MSEILKSASELTTEHIADAKNAFGLLSPKQQEILHKISTEALVLVLDGLPLDEILHTLKENHPETVSALDALYKIP